MTKLEVLTLLFAPATVGLVVTALRRTPQSVYWSFLFGSVVLASVVLALLQAEAGQLVNGPLVLGAVFLVVPTIGAFSAGRLRVLSSRGPFVFAGACSAYLLTLGLALAAAVTLGLLNP
jgi:hypothetical protein